VSCWQVLSRRAGSHGVGSVLAELRERAGDRRRQVVGDGDPFEDPADLRAESADRLTVVRIQERQPIEPIVDRPRCRHDPPEGVRRHAKTGRHGDAFNPRKLPQVRTLAANDRDLRPIDLVETQHVFCRWTGHRRGLPAVVVVKKPSDVAVGPGNEQSRLVATEMCPPIVETVTEIQRRMR
jgi:hypothetical protein